MGQKYRIVGIFALTLAAVGLAGAAFWAGRSLGERTPAVADLAQTPVAEGATPEPGETPDPAHPETLIKWVNRDSSLPRLDQVVAGISVGPNAERGGGPCMTKRPPVDLEFSRAAGSQVDIQPRFMPEGAELRTSGAVQCGDEVAIAEVFYRLPVADDILGRVAAGERYWDLPRGGSIQILRLIGRPAEASSIAAERWYAGSVAGYPAAIGRPILDEGLGDCEVMIYGDGVLTVVRTTNISLAVTLQIAAPNRCLSGIYYFKR